MRAHNKLRAFPRQIGAPSQDLLVRLSELIFEFSQTVVSADLVEKLADHAAELSGALNAVVLLNTGSEWQIAAISSSSRQLNTAMKTRLAKKIAGFTNDQTVSPLMLPAERVLGPSDAAKLGWRELVLIPLSRAETQPLGTLLLAEPAVPTNSAEMRLLKALARHAAVVLDNRRLFSRVEQSRRNWVKDFDAITDFILVHNAENVILRVNRSLAEFLGVPLSELLGKKVNVLRPLAPKAPNRICHFCHTGARQRGDSVHAANGRTYLISTSHISSSDEEPRTIHVFKDITERQELERRYQELFDNIQEGLFFCTPEGQFLEVNGTLVRMLGYSSAEDVLKLNLFEHLCVRPDTRERFRREIEKSGVLQNREEVLHRPDGTLIHVLQNLLAVKDAQRKIVQYRGLMLDITEQKTFQTQLQRERDFNKNILNDTQSMIFVLDTAGLVSYANRRVFEAGFKLDALLGRPFVERLPADRQQIFLNALQRAIHGVPVDGLELPVSFDGGRTAEFSVSLSPMRDEQGNINNLVVVMTDITDALDLQAKLMHTEKMAAVGQLVSGVAHEVNNPLAAISGFTELLLENPAVPNTAKEELRVILNEAQRTKVIVQDLLSFARQTPSHREPVDINAVMRQTLKLRSYDLMNRGIRLVEKFSEKTPTVVGDAHQLQQVFLNILNNAYDAVQETGRQGRILIETRSQDNHIEIIFCDNGPGISNLDRIFEPFFTTKEVGKGTGLGLSICYGIVRGHGGEIVCHNNQQQPGVTFLVRLPAASAQSKSEMAAAETA